MVGDAPTRPAPPTQAHTLPLDHSATSYKLKKDFKLTVLLHNCNDSRGLAPFRPLSPRRRPLTFQYVAQESSEPTPKKKRGATPKKKFLSTLRGGGGGAGGMQSPGGPLAVRSTNFHLLTSLAVTVDSLNKTQFALDQVSPAAPVVRTPLGRGAPWPPCL